MKRLVIVALAFVIGSLSFMLLNHPHVVQKPLPVFEVSDKPLLTLEQQRELVQEGSTAFMDNGVWHVIKVEGEIPQELRPYLWAYPE